MGNFFNRIVFFLIGFLGIAGKICSKENPVGERKHNTPKADFRAANFSTTVLLF